MDEAEYQKQMEEVKKSCPFCKIIAGEIPSQKVFEDDKVLCILDIHPFRPGHTLVIPKEHFPIVPILPAELYSHLFKIVEEIGVASAKATANPYYNVFVANGGVAGQQSHHCMVHVIPNEHQGGFEIPVNKIGEAEIEKTFSVLSKVLPLRMKDYIAKNSSLIPSVILSAVKSPVKIESKTESKIDNAKIQQEQVKQQLSAPSVFANLTIDQACDLLMTNNELLNVLITTPDKFKQMIPNHPQLSVLFSKLSVDEVIIKLKEKIGKKQPDLNNVDFEGVLNLIISNPLVRDAMLSDIIKFKQLIPQNPTLSKLFSKANVDDVYARLKEMKK